MLAEITSEVVKLPESDGCATDGTEADSLIPSEVSITRKHNCSLDSLSSETVTKFHSIMSSYQDSVVVSEFPCLKI